MPSEKERLTETAWQVMWCVADPMTKPFSEVYEGSQGHTRANEKVRSLTNDESVVFIQKRKFKAAPPESQAE